MLLVQADRCFIFHHHAYADNAIIGTTTKPVPFCTSAKLPRSCFAAARAQSGNPWFGQSRPSKLTGQMRRPAKVPDAAKATKGASWKPSRPPRSRFASLPCQEPCWQIPQARPSSLVKTRLTNQRSGRSIRASGWLSRRRGRRTFLQPHASPPPVHFSPFHPPPPSPPCPRLHRQCGAKPRSGCPPLQ